MVSLACSSVSGTFGRLTSSSPTSFEPRTILTGECRKIDTTERIKPLFGLRYRGRRAASSFSCMKGGPIRNSDAGVRDFGAHQGAQTVLRLTLGASTQSLQQCRAASAGGLAGDGDAIIPQSSFPVSSDASETTSELATPAASQATLKAAAAAAAGVVLVALLIAARAHGGPHGLLSAVAKSGFTAAFSLIFVSEIGDKTFFIAALLAMRHSRSLVLAGAVSALGIMSIISAAIGFFFRSVPQQLQTTLPIGEYGACALLVWFGYLSIRSALAIPAESTKEKGKVKGNAVEKGSGEEEGELAEAREFIEEAKKGKAAASPLAIFWEAFSLIFVAEWGDRSMLATIALGAAQSPVGVAAGATMGHLFATGLAVIGGALLSEYISERVVGLISGVLFLIFAVATLLGVF